MEYGNRSYERGLSKLYIILIRPERNVRQSIMPVRYSRKPPPAHPLPHPPINVKKAPSADKETQTDPADFKFINGQTVQLINDPDKKPQEQPTKEAKSQANNVAATNDKSSSTPINNDKADTL